MTAAEQIIGGYAGMNMPGVLTLYVIEKKQVLSVLDPIRHRLQGSRITYVPYGGIVLKTGTPIYRMKFPPLGCGYSEVPERNGGGLQCSVSVSFGIPGNRDDVKAFFLEKYESQWVVLVEFANRRAVVVGNEERGLRFTQGHSVGSSNVYACTFGGVLAIPALYMETSGSGLVLAEQFPDTDFSIDFSLDLNA